MLDLDAVLAAEAGTVRLFGRPQVVKALDLQGYRVVRMLAEGALSEADYEAQLFPMLRRHLPGTTDAELLTLTTGVVAQLLRLMETGIAEVAATAPKTSAPTRPRRGSSRTIRTPHSSPA